MIFKSIEIQNFLSMEYGKLQLEKQGFCLINGKNDYDMTNSNGVGKSILSDAITYCLFGNTIRGTKDIQNKITMGKVEVTLELSYRGNDYKITRTKEPSGIIIKKNNEDISGKGIRDSELILENEFTELTEDILGNIIIFGQGMPRRFTSNTPVKRKELLETLTKSDFMIEDLKGKLDKQREKVKKDLREQEDKELELNTTLNITKNRIINYELKLKELKNKNINNLNNELNNFKKDIEISKMELNQINLDKVQKEGEKLSDLILNKTTKHNEEKWQIENEYNKKITNEENIKTKLQIEIKQLNLKIEECKKEFCPTCKQRISEHIDTSNMEKELEKLNSEQGIQLDTIKELKVQLQKDLNSLGELNCEKEEKERQELRDTYRELYNKQKTLQNDIQVKEGKCKEIEFQINNYHTSIKNCEQELSKEDETLKQIEQSINKVTVRIEQIKALNEIINKIYSYTTKEFRTELLEGIITQIELIAKKYSLELFETEEIGFKQEGPNIFIGYEGKEFESLSGGQQQRVNIIIQLAIREFLLSYGLTSNLLILDEIYTGISPEGIEKVNNLILKLGIESIFLITHHDTELVPYDKVVTVYRNQEGISSYITV